MITIMNYKVIIGLIIAFIIILLLFSFLFFYSDSKNSTINDVNVTQFNVDEYIQSQLIDHNFKIPNLGTVYDRYLTEEYYNTYLQGDTLDDPIIKYTFTNDVNIDQKVSGPANPSTIVIYPTFTSAAYSEPGFYTFFADACDESCITDLSFAILN